MNPRIVYAQTAIDSIREHTRAAGARETGGTLVGFQRGELLVILAAGGPGPADRSSRAEFRLLDEPFHQEFVDRHREAEPASDWIGYWHKHPADYRVPSDVDLEGARANTERYDLPGGILLPISFVDPEGVRISNFWLSRGERDFTVRHAEAAELDSGLAWARTLSGRVWIQEFRRRLRERGYVSRLVAGSLPEQVGVEVSHEQRDDHRLFLLSAAPQGDSPRAWVRLHVPGEHRGRFVSHHRGVELEPVGDWQLVDRQAGDPQGPVSADGPPPEVRP
jgi:integrative and conjugative element protein (TIGR02256 family)